MKIISNYKNEVEEYGDELQDGDVVFMRGSASIHSFYGIYCYGIGILELENGSDAYARTPDRLYVKEKISYWTIEKVFKNCELIIKE